MTTKTEAINLEEEALSAFCRKHHIARLSLFGSILTKDFRADSDVDALVVFEPDARIGFMALARAQHELSELLQRPVDLVPESGLKPLIRVDVLNSAEVIYAA